MKLGDLIGDAGQREIRKLSMPQVRCKTGKVGFATKDAARAALKRDRGLTGQTIKRCPWCDQFHTGHRRGQVW